MIKLNNFVIPIDDFVYKIGEILKNLKHVKRFFANFMSPFYSLKIHNLIFVLIKISFQRNIFYLYAGY